MIEIPMTTQKTLLQTLNIPIKLLAACHNYWCIYLDISQKLTYENSAKPITTCLLS